MLKEKRNTFSDMNEPHQEEDVILESRGYIPNFSYDRLRAADDDLTATSIESDDLVTDKSIEQKNISITGAKFVRSSVHENKSSFEIVSPSPTPNNLSNDYGTPVKNNTGIAAIYMLIGATSMGTMNVVGKYISLETSVTVMQMGIARGIIMTVLCYLHCKWSSI